MQRIRNFDFEKFLLVKVYILDKMASHFWNDAKDADFIVISINQTGPFKTRTYNVCNIQNLLEHPYSFYIPGDKFQHNLDHAK